MRARSFGLGAAFLLWAGCANAGELKVLTVGGLQKPIEKIAADYKNESGGDVKFTFTNPASLQKALSETSYDVIILADTPIIDLEKSGKLIAGSHRKIVHGGIGVAVKEGSKLPDVATPQALKATLLAAKAIVYTDPATPNGSGEKTKQILEDLDVWDAVVAKGKALGLGPGKEAVAKGEFDLGLFNASESEAPGCVLAGTMPASIQHYTNYDAGVMSNTSNVAAAASFVKFLTGPTAATRWTAGHMTPDKGA